MKIVNFSAWNGQPYAEIGQSNKLRWMNVKPVGEDTYEPVSKWWMCKDFMNDAITAKHIGKKFSIYGFTCDPETFWAPDQKHMYVLLKNVADGWFSNMEVVNTHLKKMRFPAITWEAGFAEDVPVVLVTIPEKYLLNTFYMSTITLFIRLANTQQPYETLDNMVADGANYGDQANYEATKKKPLNKLPKQYKEYVWHYNGVGCLRNGGADQSFMTSVMHNCGVVNWSWGE